MHIKHKMQKKIKLTEKEREKRAGERHLPRSYPFAGCDCSLSGSRMAAARAEFPFQYRFFDFCRADVRQLHVSSLSQRIPIDSKRECGEEWLVLPSKSPLDARTCFDTIFCKDSHRQTRATTFSYPKLSNTNAIPTTQFEREKKTKGNRLPPAKRWKW